VRGYLKDDKSIRALAVQHGVSYGTVHRVLTDNEVPKHSRGWRG
jgi:DNA-binding transcriptional regulator YhcF (GntR family)